MHGVLDGQSFSEPCIRMADDLKRVVAWKNLPMKGGFREDRNRLRLTADGLAEFDERHPKKPSDFPGRSESIFFVKTNCPMQRVGCVDSDCLTSRLSEFAFGCFKERNAQARSVPFGVDRHTSKVSFAALQNLVSDGPNDISGSAGRHNDRHI